MHMVVVCVRVCECNSDYFRLEERITRFLSTYICKCTSIIVCLMYTNFHSPTSPLSLSLFLLAESLIVIEIETILRVSSCQIISFSLSLYSDSFDGAQYTELKTLAERMAAPEPLSTSETTTATICRSTLTRKSHHATSVRKC